MYLTAIWGKKSSPTILQLIVVHVIKSFLVKHVKWKLSFYFSWTIAVEFSNQVHLYTYTMKKWKMPIDENHDKKMLWQYSSITFVSICCNSIVFCSVHSCTERFVLTFRCTKYTCSSDILIRGGTKILLAVVTS
jgi:hypothetical protein